MKPPTSKTPMTASSANTRKACHSYLLMVQNLIERCLLRRMDRDQCVQALAKHASVKPAITLAVWRGLEKENKEFFAEYARRNEDEPRQARAGEAGETPPHHDNGEISSRVTFSKQRLSDCAAARLWYTAAAAAAARQRSSLPPAVATAASAPASSVDDPSAQGSSLAASSDAASQQQQQRHQQSLKFMQQRNPICQHYPSCQESECCEDVEMRSQSAGEIQKQLQQEWDWVVKGPSSTKPRWVLAQGGSAVSAPSMPVPVSSCAVLPAAAFPGVSDGPAAPVPGLSLCSSSSACTSEGGSVCRPSAQTEASICTSGRSEDCPT